MTTSIHLCLGPCVGLVALLSLLRSSCFWRRLSLMRSRWPSRCNHCFCIAIAIGSSHARSKLSEFLILFHLKTLKIDRMHRMWNVFKLCKFGCVTDQVSHPYSKTGLTKARKIFIFVEIENCLLVNTLSFQEPKTLLALLIRASISAMHPPSWLMILPK